MAILPLFDAFNTFSRAEVLSVTKPSQSTLKLSSIDKSWCGNKAAIPYGVADGNTDCIAEISAVPLVSLTSCSQSSAATS